MGMKRRHKYGAVRTEYQGERYDSRAEARRAMDLVLLKAAGKIHRWERGEAQVLLEGRTRSRRVTYKPDFIVWDTERRAHAEDVKGMVPKDFRIKAILWERRFPDLPLRVVDANGNLKWSLDGVGA